MKKIAVENISQYFEAIAQFDKAEYISRGEYIDNKNTILLASALRNNEISWYRTMQKYKFNVLHRLTDLQKEYIRAFCQHHHIHTNLLDFSYSALVSLFFAVSNNFESKNNVDNPDKNNGYVYFLDKSRCVNINKIIQENSSDWGLLWDLLYYEEKTIKYLAKNSKNAFIYKNIDICYDTMEIIDEIINLLETNKVDLKNLKITNNKYYKPLNKAAKSRKNVGMFKAFENYLEQSVNELNSVCSDINCFYYQIFNNYENIKSDDLDYFFNKNQYNYFLLQSVKYHLDTKFGKCNKKEITMPIYFVYEVPTIEDRVANQQSLFIFQPYTNSRIIQKILPDYTIEIINRKKLLDQLCLVGIDDKYIFNDYDSIGKFYTEHSEKEPFYKCKENDKETNMLFDEKSFFMKFE